MVIGVSRDGQDSHAKFVKKLNLPFERVTDRGGRLAKAYGVGKKLFVMPGRVTFVIDRDGKVASVYDSSKAKSHVPEALAVVKRLG